MYGETVEKHALKNARYLDSISLLTKIQISAFVAVRSSKSCEMIKSIYSKLCGMASDATDAVGWQSRRASNYKELNRKSERIPRSLSKIPVYRGRGVSERI